MSDQPDKPAKTKLGQELLKATDEAIEFHRKPTDRPAPREFAIALGEIMEPGCELYDGELFSDIAGPNDFHLIEYSAFAALRAERDEYKEKYQEQNRRDFDLEKAMLIDERDMAEELWRNLKQERDALKAEVERLAGELAGWKNMFALREEALSRYEKALERIASLEERGLLVGTYMKWKEIARAALEAK